MFLSAAAEAAKTVDEDRSTIGLKVNIGKFDEVRSSLALSYAHSEDGGLFPPRLAALPPIASDTVFGARSR